MNVHCTCWEWDFLWSVTKGEEKEQCRLPHIVVYKLTDWSWEAKLRKRGPINGFDLEWGKVRGGGGAGGRVQVGRSALSALFMFPTLCVSCILRHLLVCECVCMSVSLIWGKTMFYIPQGNRVITEAGTRAWGATALRVARLDWARFLLRRDVEHSLCHYRCPAVQTSLPPRFSRRVGKVAKQLFCRVPAEVRTLFTSYVKRCLQSGFMSNIKLYFF